MDVTAADSGKRGDGEEQKPVRLCVRRVWIDRRYCTATTLCAYEAPGLVESHRSGDYFSVKQWRERTQENLKLLFDAANVCPMAAFRVTLADGTSYVVDDEPWILDAIERGDYEWEQRQPGRLYVKRVWIDRENCLAHTLCEPEASGLIECDEAGQVYKVREAALQRTPQELKELLEANSVCPMGAFRVLLEDGKTYVIGDEPWIKKAIERGDYEWSKAD